MLCGGVISCITGAHVCTGRSWQDKVSDIREKMETEGASVVMVTELDEVACELDSLHVQ